MQDGPLDNSGWINTSSFCEGAEQYNLHFPFQISQTSPSTVRHPKYTLCVHPLGNAAAQSISTERECTKDTCSSSRYVFRSTAQRPPVCLQVSGQLASLSELFGDWPRAKQRRQIVMLMHLPPAPLRGSSSDVLIDWAPASIALFNPVGLAQGLHTHSMRCPRR